MPRNRRLAGWIVLFVALFGLSLDYWSWDGAIRLAVLNLPTWVYYFVVLQFVLAAAVYRFSTTYWRDREECDGSEGDESE